MLQDVIQSFKNRGVEFIGLSEALSDPIYSIDPQIIGAHSSEFTYQIMKMRKIKPTELGLHHYEAYTDKIEKLCL